MENMSASMMDNAYNSNNNCDRYGQSDAISAGVGRASSVIGSDLVGNSVQIVGAKSQNGVQQQESKTSLSKLMASSLQLKLDKMPAPGKGPKCVRIEAQEGREAIKPTRKRYFILFMFNTLQVIKSFQWICLASITNMVAKFYDVDNLAINYTTILFMVTFLILALPVSWIMDSIGLRRSVLIGSIGVTVGVIIKCFSCTRDGFALSMLGHLIIGLSEPFFFSSYAQVASVWFPDHQVAMATAASLIGEQFGLALGFIIPPLMIGNDPTDFVTIQSGLRQLFTVVAIICTLNTASILFFFDDQPKFAPGVARSKQIVNETVRRQSQAQALALDPEFKQGRRFTSTKSNERAIIGRGRRLSRRVSQSLDEQMKLSSKFFSNKHFIFLLIGFGINEGIAYSLHTLLNQMIIGPPETLIIMDDEANIANRTLLPAHETTDTNLLPMSRINGDDSNLIVGNAGLILIVSGLVGSALCGFVLDKYHKYKLTTAAVYLMGLISMAALTGCLLLESELLLYLVSIPLGFSLTGYINCAFDYGVEINYPKPELLSSTLLNISAQIFGIPISLVGSVIVDNYGSQALGAFFCAILTVGFIITCLQGGQLRRQDAVHAGELRRERQTRHSEQLDQVQQDHQHPVWAN